MQKAYINYQGYRLHYATIGSGPSYLLAFHGYGQDATVFNAFANSLGRHYTILSFDLFHHGGSTYPLTLAPNTPLAPALYKAMLDELLNRLGITTFGLMGYSMGGRICLHLAPMYGKQVTSLYLFAPDGIKRSYGYLMGISTPLGRSLFKVGISAGGLVLGLLKLGNALGIVNSKAHAFFVTQINSKPKRQKLYNTWLSYRLFMPNLDTVATLINQGQIKLHLFVGKYDKVLPPWTVRRLVKRLNPPIQPTLINSGHDLISPKTSTFLQDYLLVK